MNGIEGIDGGILVERVAGVVRRAGGRGDSIAGFDPVADGVVLIGAITGVVCTVIGGDDLAEGIVLPRPARGSRKCGAAGGNSGALAEQVHAVVVTGHNRGANLVFSHVEHVAGGFVGEVDVVDASGGGGDFLKEAGAALTRHK